jgi:hypothetical protein
MNTGVLAENRKEKMKKNAIVRTQQWHFYFLKRQD